MKKLRKKTLGFLSGFCGIAISLLCGTSCGEEKEIPVMYGPVMKGYEDVQDTVSDDSAMKPAKFPKPPDTTNNPT